MKWNKFTLKTRSDAEDLVIAALAEAGIQGVEIEDKVPLTARDKEQMFVDILPDVTDDGIAYLNFYLEEDEDKEAVLARVREELNSLAEFTDIGEASITESQTEDKDWINNWKQYFKQFYVDDLLIIPSWEEVKPEDQGRPVIHIDPGTAFGTGMHETTQLCIRQLKKYVKDGCRMLDVGCGSGILSIAALLFGASYTVMTDLDPCAISSSEENMAENGISRERFQVMEGNLIDDPAVQDAVGYGIYDIAAANILAEVLVPLMPAVSRCLKEGGVGVFSGILQEKAPLVTEAAKRAGLDILDIAQQGEWVSVTARK